MEHEQANTKTPPLRDIDAPTGLDLHPDPPETVRVSKLAGLIVLFVLCGLATVFGYGVYQRRNTSITPSVGSDDEKRIGPAITAARDITREIPEGVIQLPDDPNHKKTISRNPPRGNSGPHSEAVSQSGKVKPPQPQLVYPNTHPEPSPEEKRRALAYERELQAIAAPTAIRSNGIGASVPALSPAPVQLPATSGDPSLLAAIAQALSGKPGTGVGEAAQNANRDFDDQNMQARKGLFIGQTRNSSGEAYLKSTRVAPLSNYEIKAGWEIPAVLEQEVNSDLPGELKALVTKNVYDTATGQHLLIPQGARMIGTYDSSITYGQSGVQAIWHRIIYPDASSIDLGSMVGQDAQGVSGFRSDVDNHYKRLVGFAVLSSLFSAGFQLSQTRTRSVLENPSVGEIAAGAVGQEVSQTGAQITRRNLNIQPTIKIPVGYKFNVRVNRDILFDSPYEARIPAR